jgi:hypothetical protein
MNSNYIYLLGREQDAVATHSRRANLKGKSVFSPFARDEEVAATRKAKPILKGTIYSNATARDESILSLRDAKKKLRKTSSNMDATSYMSVASYGIQQDYDDQIIREVWTEKYSNLSETEASASCEEVYEKQGASAYNRCYLAGVSCKDNAACNEVAKRYAKALAKGYSKDFEAFKKRSQTLSQIGSTAGELLGGLLSGLGIKDTPDASADVYSGDYSYEEPKKKTGLYVGLGLVAAVGIGFAIYFATKKK